MWCGKGVGVEDICGVVGKCFEGWDSDCEFMDDLVITVHRQLFL